MLSGILIILIPMIIGYFISLNQNFLLKIIDFFLNYIIYVILFFMGINLALLDNLVNDILKIIYYTTVTITNILCCNIIFLICLEKFTTFFKCYNITQLPPRISLYIESLKIFSPILLGFFLGLTKWSFLRYSNEATKYTLILLIFLVGIQLRNNRISLKIIMLNKHGITTSIVVVISSLIGGIINSLILDLPINIGLAMASGFGWYSLSGVLLTESFGPIIGSAAFFNDLARELIAMILIPILSRHSSSAALGLCGATSMDFTLPILKNTIGQVLVPAAIIHGFILSLLVPILISLFS